jgi:hypothetical protein
VLETREKKEWLTMHPKKNHSQGHICFYQRVPEGITIVQYQNMAKLGGKRIEIL